MAHGEFFLEVECAQHSKHGKHVCGDTFRTLNLTDEGRTIAALSDGLGSGIKACILSQMVATMATRFCAANRDLASACDVILKSLPICQVRKIRYATLTLIDTTLGESTRIIEWGNPRLLLVRGGELVPVAYDLVRAEAPQEDPMYRATVDLQPEDRLIFCSDGVSQAGLGTEEHKLGWGEAGWTEFALATLRADGTLSARDLADRIAREAQCREPRRQTQDDISCGVVYLRRPRKLLLLTGPPYHEINDARLANRLLTYPGKRVICGGTTATIIGRELGCPPQMDLRLLDDLPPISRMEGVDLVTEGILTLTRAIRYLEEGFEDAPPNGAVRLCRLLLNSDQIECIVGTQINTAHQDPNLPQDLELRRNILRRLSDILREKYRKDVHMELV